MSPSSDSSSDSSLRRLLIAVIALLVVIASLMVYVALNSAKQQSLNVQAEKATNQQKDQATDQTQTAAKAIEAQLYAERQKPYKDKTIIDARTIGLDFLDVAEDNKEKFPATKDEFLKDVSQGGYRKSDSEFAREPGVTGTEPDFVYEAAGHSLNEENAFSHEIGYKRGMGGRAVIFADSHVHWQNDK